MKLLCGSILKIVILIYINHELLKLLTNLNVVQHILERSRRRMDYNNNQNQSRHKNHNNVVNWDIGKRYRATEVIGKGSYGAVAKAVDRFV